MATYAANKRWRKKHPEKRAAMVERNYQRHNHQTNKYQKYTTADYELITTKTRNGKKFLDREIAALLGRPLRAIHVVRSRLKHGTYKVVQPKQLKG